MAPEPTPQEQDVSPELDAESSELSESSESDSETSDTEDADLNAPAPLSDEFCFSDANVILESSTKRYLVHRSVLCRHSTVFKKMLRSPVAVTVPVQGSDGDWNALLSMFYDTPSLREEGTGLIPFGTMQAMLRLGFLYGFAQKDYALKQLKELLPDTLEGWDSLLISGDPKKQQLREFGNKHAVALLCVARELDIKRCLPMAYFSCLRYRKSAEISQIQDPLIAPPAQPLPVLSSKTKLTLLTGKEKIRNRLFSHTFSWWHNARRPESCIAKVKCKQAIYTVLQAQRLDENPTRRALDPIHRHSTLLSNLCRFCKPEATVAYNKGRATLFKALPSIFCETAGWDDLEGNF